MSVSESTAPTFYTPADVARIFDLGEGGEQYVLNNFRRWPHVWIKRQPRFSPEDVEEIARIERRHPGAQPVGDESSSETGVFDSGVKRRRRRGT